MVNTTLVYILALCWPQPNRNLPCHRQSHTNIFVWLCLWHGKFLFVEIICDIVTISVLWTSTCYIFILHLYAKRYIEAWKKPTFCRRYFQMHSNKIIFLISNHISLKSASYPIHNTAALVQGIARCSICDSDKCVRYNVGLITHTCADDYGMYE